MKLKVNKPVTPSQRHLITLNTKMTAKKPLLKEKIKGLKNSSGRNNFGKITIRHLGGGHKKNYRIINFSRIENSIGIVCSIEYDPNRNTHIGSVFDINSANFFYTIAPKNLKIGDIIKSGQSAETKLGHSLPLSRVPVGSLVHSVSTKPKKPAQVSRSAGTFSKLIEKTFSYVKIKLSSGKKIRISPDCFAAIGIVSNELFHFCQLGKAGRKRWLNRRSSVRGVAMNPIDHPHGGGEGKKSGKGFTPWGKPTKLGKLKKSLDKNYEQN